MLAGIHMVQEKTPGFPQNAPALASGSVKPPHQTYCSLLSRLLSIGEAHYAILNSDMRSLSNSAKSQARRVLYWPHREWGPDEAMLLYVFRKEYAMEYRAILRSQLRNMK